MNLREALRNKKQSAKTMNHQVNAWQVYGEESLVLFYADWVLSSNNLDKLIDYLSLVDKLVLALPEGTSENKLFEIANLQVIDGIVLYQSVIETMQAFSGAKFAFEGIEAPDLSPDLKVRILAL